MTDRASLAENLLLAGARHASAPTVYLRDCRPIRPQPGQTRVLGYVLSIAGSALGDFDLGGIAFVWRAAPRDYPRAQTSGAGNGHADHVTVDVRADLGGVELAEVLFHEVMHAAQLASGRWHTMTRQAREEEAVRFAASAMRGELL